MQDPIKEYLSKLGKKGGKATAKKMTPDQLKDRARKGGLKKAENRKKSELPV